MLTLRAYNTHAVHPNLPSAQACDATIVLSKCAWDVNKVYTFFGWIKCHLHLLTVPPQFSTVFCTFSQVIKHIIHIISWYYLEAHASHIIICSDRTPGGGTLLKRWLDCFKQVTFKERHCLNTSDKRLLCKNHSNCLGTKIRKIKSKRRDERWDGGEREMDEDQTERNTFWSWLMSYWLVISLRKLSPLRLESKMRFRIWTWGCLMLATICL